MIVEVRAESTKVFAVAKDYKGWHAAWQHHDWSSTSSTTTCNEQETIL
jgi:hypothetical protein